MRFYSEHGKTLPEIKKRIVKTLLKDPCPIDPDVLDIVIAINQLPFVVQTVESCSGHIDCSTGLPKKVEDAVKSYWNHVRFRYGDARGYNKKLFKKYMHPKYQLAAYFFSSRFYKRFLQGKDVPYRHEFIHNLDPDLKESFLHLCEIQNPRYTNFSGLIVDSEQRPIFEAIANFVYRQNPKLEIYALLRELAAQISNDLKDVRYCDWSWGQGPDSGTFLDIIYVECSKARKFHQDLSRLFRGKDDYIALRYKEGIEILEGMLTGDPDALCIFCYEPQSDECNCIEEIFPDGNWSPEKDLKKLKKKAKVQFEAAYWKTLRVPHTEAILDRFWDKVWDVIRKYS